MTDEPEVTPVVVDSEDLNERISQFIWARDQLAKLDERWENERKELVSIKSLLEGRIQAFLEANNVESIKTKAGTAYTTIKWSAPVADPQAFIDYVVNTGQFDLMERRASVTAVKKFVEDNKFLPAGVSLSHHKSLRVRR